MNEILSYIQKFAVGACFAGMIASVLPHSTEDTLMVNQQKRQIEKKTKQLDVNETIIRGKEGERVIYAIKKGKLISVATEIPGINYDEKGMPVSEKTGKPNVPFSVAFGIAAILLAIVPHIRSLATKLSESMASSSARRKERNEKKAEEKAAKAMEKAKAKESGSWL
jgi:hypothetical protein